MFQYPPLEPLQSKGCFGCRFCVFDNERQEYGCQIKGCVDMACYVEFQGIYDKEKKEWK